MKNLMTRKLVLGMFMAFVLAFGVVGIAEALKLTATSDTVQSQRTERLDGPFTIKFSVGLTGQKSVNNTRNKRVNADDGVTRIDSSGYEVIDLANGRTYRVIHASPAYSPSSTDHKVGPRPEYGTNSAGDNLPPSDLASDPASPLYVDTGGNVFDSSGEAVYVQTGTGVRDPKDDWDYARLKAVPQDPVGVSQRYDFNNERITVTVNPATNIIITDGLGYNVTTPQVMGENIDDDPYQRLRSTVTLTCRIAAAGTYVITIMDSTVDVDFTGTPATPAGVKPPIGAPLTFTLYVTDEDVLDTDGDLIAFTTGERSLKRQDTSTSRENVSSHFDFNDVGSNTRIRYQVVKGSGNLDFGKGTTTYTDVTAHKSVVVFLNTNNTTNEVVASVAGTDSRTEGLKIVFEYTGSGRPTAPSRPSPDPPPDTTPTITLFPTTLSGAPGTTTTLTAIVSNGVAGVPVTFTLSTSSGSVLSPVQTLSNGQAQTSILLPTSSGTVTASASGYRASSINISVTGTAPTDTTPSEPAVLEPASIEIYDGDDQQGEINQRLDEDLVVQVLDRNNNGVSFELVRFRIVEGRGRVSPSSTRTDRDGLADVTFTPRSQGTVEVEAYLGDLSPVIFTVNVGEPPDAIKKISGDNQSGRPGERLANPFVVEVVDENDDPVSGATVAFSVTAGGGSVSPTSATTNASGRAQTVLTLGDEIGDNTVSARVTGLTGVTFGAGAGATVHVDASNRAPIYWIDKQNGTLHRLVDDDVENLASNVEGVTSLAVDEANGLIYWGVQVGRSGGKIQRSRLNGRNIQVLKDGLTSIPMGIALDGAGGTIYWTSASGKIRSMATEGSTKVTKILEDLANPTVLAVSNGYLYWVEPLGRVRRVSLTATRKVAVNIATGLGEPLSIAIANGKIYWVERNGGKGGSLQRANLNGGNIEELKAFTGGVPVGISIDRSENKIYWTKLSKIQRTNLTGRSVTDVVTGLTRPGAIALGVEAAEPAVQQTTRTTRTTQTTTTTQQDNSKYDVNSDGTVDLLDVFAPILQPNNMKNDVNGDGVVDAKDAQEIDANRDDAAAAPAIDVDVKALDLDFDRVQEQIEALLASGDMSLGTQRALLYLQHLLASARPDATVLLANYPNPFNPETWIPYHLATSTDVRVNIYNAQGILVRSLTLGHQSAGYYTSRSRSAYWDGRNALGERVASGIYFYQLQADEISPMRKMVILK